MRRTKISELKVRCSAQLSSSKCRSFVNTFYIHLTQTDRTSEDRLRDIDLHMLDDLNYSESKNLCDNVYLASFGRKFITEHPALAG